MIQPVIFVSFPGSPYQNVNIETAKAVPLAFFPDLRPVVDRLQFAYCERLKSGGENSLGKRIRFWCSGAWE